MENKMRRRKSLYFVTAAVLIVLLSGCSGQKVMQPGSIESPGVNAQPEDTYRIEETLQATPQPDEEAITAQEITTEEQVTENGEILIDITEKMYVAWINEIYTNTDLYLGQKIRIEGMYTSQLYEPTNTTYYYVYRVGPGCCGNDGSMCGFEFSYDGEMPQDNDWIEVIGTLDKYEEEGNTYLTLRAESVTVRDERGSETVIS